MLNQQVGFREMLVHLRGLNARIQRMSTGAKHLHGDRPAYLSACKRLTRFAVRLHNYQRKY